MLVTAPPGTGKSWLVDTAAARVERADGKVVRAVCTPARGDVRVIATWLLELGPGVDGAPELAAAAGPAPGAALLRATGLTHGSEGDGSILRLRVADADGRGPRPRRPRRPRRRELRRSSASSRICTTGALLELLDLLSRLALRSGIARRCGGQRPDRTGSTPTSSASSCSRSVR